jgi:hypothetical protein
MPYIDYRHNLEAPRRSLLTYDLKQIFFYCDSTTSVQFTSYKIDDLQPLKKINLNLLFYLTFDLQVRPYWSLRYCPYYVFC